MSTLDTRTTEGILGLLSDARRDFGTTVVLVTHELEAVGAICDRVAVLERGVLQRVFPVARTDYAREHASYLAHAERVLGA